METPARFVTLARRDLPLVEFAREFSGLAVLTAFDHTEFSVLYRGQLPSPRRPPRHHWTVLEGRYMLVYAAGRFTPEPDDGEVMPDWFPVLCVFFSPCAPCDPVSPLFDYVHLVQVCLVYSPHSVLYLKCCLFLVSLVRCHQYMCSVSVPVCPVLPLFGSIKTVTRYTPSSPHSSPPLRSTVTHISSGV